MAINRRQSDLLVAENWKKIYQTFQEADFTSYDFETLRKTMIDYIRLYYPEDFNDFTESSEFIALIDLIAFMGQSLAFRADLNARENFIDTAERRDSILKLARLVSYNPKRNISASGYLKIDSISTTETLTDSNGLNLSNLIVNWNDQSNDNWLEQFTTVFNATLVNGQVIGKPGNSQVINSINTDEYSLSLVDNVLGVYKFQAPVEDSNFDFEIVSATSVGKNYIYEVPPNINNPFNILYRNDNYGNASNNTGFFVYFKQGLLNNQDFSITNATPNRIINIGYNNINNTDIWLYAMNNDSTMGELWQKIPAVNGLNVIYNKSTDRNLYQVNTLAGDQIDLVFGDGSFANRPAGNYRAYFRTSNGLTYKITPDEMKGVNFTLNYVSRDNRVETISIRASLQYTISNASARENSNDIKIKAPQQYYTQNRMITGEDYNILPYTTFNNVVKVKSVNRTSSGISRYLDVIDSTGKYSSTNIFGQDGVLYRDNNINSFRFSFNSTVDVLKVINGILTDTITSKEILHFYYASYPTYALTPVDYVWQLSTVGSNASTGYFTSQTNSGPYTPVGVGGTVSNNAKYIRKGALVTFRPRNGYYFDANSNMLPGNPRLPTDHTSICVTITEIYGDGTNQGLGNLDNGSGPVLTNIKVPSGAIVERIYPVFKNAFTSYFIDIIVGFIKSFKNFGISYGLDKQSWQVITAENLNSSGTFGLTNQGDVSGTALDDSWLVRFLVTENGYMVYYRGISYVFNSVNETTFYYDNTVKIYDTKTGTVINDQIKILKTNSQPDSASALGKDYTWYIYKPCVDVDGYVNKNRIFVTFADSNNDGIPDDPELFNVLTNPLVDVSNKLVFFQLVTGYDNFIDLQLVNNATVVTLYSTQDNIVYNANLYLPGQVFYATVEGNFYSMNTLRSIVAETKYIAKLGRQDLAFQYKHNSPNNRRIDPGCTNVNDIYVLTSAYQTNYQNWIRDTSITVAKPIEPTTEELSLEFSSLNDVKSVSDTIVFNSAKFKLIFGNKAPINLQATFKIIKNSSIITSDNDIKTSVITAINTYFDISNWDFGETFYFSELSAYLHKVLTPAVASILIVPVNPGTSFGSLYQINAEPYEIIVSSATVENIEIISAITANQLNLTSTNKDILI